jgi:tRNA threonylcarbamoyladenosine biosynthesis protein TsaB
MRILAIDTSLGSGSVAAVDPDGSAERPLGPAGGHARVLTEALAEVAAARGWGEGPQALGSLGPSDVVAVIRGPGSFTGLRVGIAAAKALAWTTGARLVGVSGFDVLARRAARVVGWHDEPIAIAYDAGRGDVFAAIATPTAGGWTASPPALVPLDAWLESLPAGGRVTGPALEAASERITARNDLAVAPPEAWHPLAADVAAIAHVRAEAGDVDDPHTLLPDYLRPSYAEERKPPAAG